MSTTKDSDDPLSFRIIDTDRNCYRDYHFIKDSKDIYHKIFQHIMYFGQNTKFHDHEYIQEIFTSLCHKVNMVKYHLRKYKEVENRIEKELLSGENLIDHDGTVLIERVELTAEYESFLIQVKATLDILVKFLNIVYRNGQKNPMKYQNTFSDGGKGVIKSLEKYLIHNEDDEEKLKDLINYIKEECIEASKEEPNTINWLVSIINKRDTVIHYRKHEYFAFQINYEGDKKSIFRPKFTKTQTVLESFEISYDNLLVFIQDFTALLFLPYLNKKLKAFTFKKEDVINYAPSWYLQLGDPLPPYMIWQNMGNLLMITGLCKESKDRITPEYCEKMYLHYASFYKKKGITITSKGIEDHTSNKVALLTTTNEQKNSSQPNTN